MKTFFPRSFLDARRFAVLALTSLFLATGVSAQIAAGGAFVLEQAVNANGGGTSGGGAFEVNGTAAQPAVGDNNAGGNFWIRNGFWRGLLGPNAASVTISGKVTRENGAGIRNVRVTLFGGPLTAPKTALTSSLGYFTFDDVEAGQTYVISVLSKQYGFGQPTQVISVVDSVTDINFVSTWLN